MVVGSCEMAYEVIAGEADFMDYFFRFLLPTGLGNVIGGTGIFTILIYNQIKGDLAVMPAWIRRIFIKTLKASFMEKYNILSQSTCK